MSWVTRKIEKKWKERFLSCDLVDKEEKSFKIRFAHQLFYGRLDDSYPTEYPDAFNDFYQKRDDLTQEEVLNKMHHYLVFIGIELEEEIVLAHLEKFPEVRVSRPLCNTLLRILRSGY
jgi:hypothetical protein